MDVCIFFFKFCLRLLFIKFIEYVGLMQRLLFKALIVSRFFHGLARHAHLCAVRDVVVLECAPLLRALRCVLFILQFKKKAAKKILNRYKKSIQLENSL